MKLSEIYLKAAKLVYSGEDEHSCWAIQSAAALGKAKMQECQIALAHYDELMHDVRLMVSGLAYGVAIVTATQFQMDGAKFRSGKEARELRVMALLFMAAESAAEGR